MRAPHRLTKRMLQKAADRITSNKDSWLHGGYGSPNGRSRFMCHAMEDACGYRAIGLLTKELTAHGVGLGGSLLYDGIYYGDWPESQEIRFDFLNLLAEAAEK